LPSFQIRRLVNLARRAGVMVCVDNEKIVDELARTAANHRVQLNVLVDVDVGVHQLSARGDGANLPSNRTLTHLESKYESPAICYQWR
jgi:D-serine deaminase-like pyridoxal phosphate-dependent protein